MDSSSNINSSNNDHIIVTMNESTSSDNIVVDSNDRNNSIMIPAEIEPNSGSAKRAAEATATLYRVAARNLSEDSPDVEEDGRYEERGMFGDDIENDKSEAEQMEAEEREEEDTSVDGNDDTSEKDEETQEEPKPKPRPESRRPIHAALVTGGINLRPRETKDLLRALDVSPYRFVMLGLVDGKALRAVDDIGGPSQGPPHGPHHLRPGHPPGMGKHGHGPRFGRPMHGLPRHHDPPRGRHDGGWRELSGPPLHGRHHSGRHLHLSGSGSEGDHGRPMHGPPRHHGPPRGRHGGGRRGHSGPPPHGRHHSGRHLHLSGSDSEGDHGRSMHDPPRHHDPPCGRHGGGRRGHSGPPPHGRHHSGRHLHLSGSGSEGDHGRPMHGPPRHHDPPRGQHRGGRRGHSGPPPHGRHHSGRHLHLSGSDFEGPHGRPMHGPPRHHDPPRGRHGGGRRGHSGPPPYGRPHSGRHLHLSGSDSEGDHGRPMHGPPRHHDPPRGRHGGGGRRGHSGPPPHGRHRSGRHLHLSGCGSEGDHGRPLHGPPRHHDPPRGRHGGGRRGHSGPPPHGRHHSGRHLHRSGSDSEGDHGKPVHDPSRDDGPPRGRHGGGGRRGHSGPPPHGRHHSGRHLHLSGSGSGGDHGRAMHGPPRHHDPPRDRHGGARRGHCGPGPMPHGQHHSGRHLHLSGSDSEGDHGRPMHGPPRHHGPPRGRHGGGRRGHSGPPPHGRHHSGRHLHLSGSGSEGDHGKPIHGPPRHHDPPRGRHGGGRRGHSGPLPHGRHHSRCHLHLSYSNSEEDHGRPMHGPPRHHDPPRGRHGGGRRGHCGPPPHGRHHSGCHLHLSGSDSEGEYVKPMHGPPRHHGPPCGRHGGGRRGKHSGPPPHGRHHSGRHLHLSGSDSEGDHGRPKHGPPRNHGPSRGRPDGTRRGKHSGPPPHGRHHSGRHLHLSNRARAGGHGRPMHDAGRYSPTGMCHRGCGSRVGAHRWRQQQQQLKAY